MKVNQDLPLGESAGDPSQSRTNPPHRILVVDDDSAVRQLSAQVLAGSGYQVDAAEDGAAAWEALQVKSFNLLITDNNMPKLTGIELVKKVRSARMDLPVILASGAMPAEELNRHPWLQLAATLLKPFTVDELLGTVKQVLRATDRAPGQLELLPDWRSQPSANSLQQR